MAETALAQSMKEIRELVSQFGIKVLVGLYLLISLIPNFDNSINARSRLATISAMTEYHQFSIDPYLRAPYGWTEDWAKTPDGHYYSNKAPGPMLYGLPVGWAVEKLLLLGVSPQIERDKLLYEKHEWVNFILSFFMQTLPFGILVLWVVARMKTRLDLSVRASGYLLSLGFFGTTAAIFMKTYWGHGLTAFFAFLLVQALLIDCYELGSFALGSAILCEYSCLLLVIPFAFAIVWREPRSKLRELAYPIAVGGLLPALLWIFYHTASFGSPFTIANLFQNPKFLAEDNSYGFIRSFSAAPNLRVLFNLVLGSSRGLLFTQPWVLAAIVSGVIAIPRFKHHRDFVLVFIFPIFSLGLFLWMNSSFNGWAGGATPGPRYLTPVLPLFIFTLGYSWKIMTPTFRRVIFVLTIPAILLYFVVSETTLLAPVNVGLWSFYWNQIMGS